MKDTAQYAEHWERNPADIPTALAYAGQLRALGQQDKMIEVLGETARRNPSEPTILAVYGKELAKASTSGQDPANLERASLVLNRAIATGRADWSVYSAQGTVLDQFGRYAEARTLYEEALKRGGNRATVLNNMGMSYVLEGKLAQAEAILSQAAADPANGNNSTLRQNLALVMGLQGKFDGARQVASRDLPSNLVDNNMSFLKNMVAEPDPWQRLKALEEGQESSAS